MKSLPFQIVCIAFLFFGSCGTEPSERFIDISRLSEIEGINSTKILGDTCFFDIDVNPEFLNLRDWFDVNNEMILFKNATLFASWGKTVVFTYHFNNEEKTMLRIGYNNSQMQQIAKDLHENPVKSSAYDYLLKEISGAELWLLNGSLYEICNKIEKIECQGTFIELIDLAVSNCDNSTDDIHPDAMLKVLDLQVKEMQAQNLLKFEFGNEDILFFARVCE
jgi:hypothetical protein